MRVDGTGGGRIRRFGLTPLIDVVFLLLLFFMLASTFHAYRSIPIAGGEGSTAAAAARDDLVLLRIGADGALDLNGVAVAPDELAGRLVALAASRGIRLIVRPHAQASVQHVVSVLDQARRANIGDVAVVR